MKSVKSLAGIDDRSQWGYVGRPRATSPGGWDYGAPPDLSPDYKVFREAEYKNVLPEDQRRFVEMTQTLAEKYGFELEIVDVAKKNFLRKLVQKQLKHISTFPTLVSEKGEKIEGYESEEEIKKLLGFESKNRR